MGRDLHLEPYYMEHHEPWWDHHRDPSGRTSAWGWLVLPVDLFITKNWIHFKCLLIRNPTEGLTR